jgi:PPM family protein phosphatase
MKQKFSIDFGASTDVGLVREENQDTFGIFPPDANSDRPSRGRLFVVADGMGGHKGGKVASELAVKTIGEVYFSDGNESVQESLVNAIQAANEVLFSASKKDPALSGMGTTCVTVVVKGSLIYVAHIGDSRVYRVTRDSIFQVTEDHTAVSEMQRRGILTAEEAKHHPERSVLYRALGTKLEAETEVQPELIVRGEEWFVLCTDGLSNMVDDSEIRDIVVAQPPRNACNQLVGLAKERGGYDNITVIVVQVTAS